MENITEKYESIEEFPMEDLPLPYRLATNGAKSIILHKLNSKFHQTKIYSSLSFSKPISKIFILNEPK